MQDFFPKAFIILNLQMIRCYRKMKSHLKLPMNLEPEAFQLILIGTKSSLG